jgi:hypothetical protein
MYMGHKLITGSESFETTNGVIQGSVNSPMLFSVYLEHFLFKDPLIKDLCNRNKLLAFADDMVVVAESWSDVRTIMSHLTKTLEDGGLLLSLPKSIIMTTRD